MSELIEFDDIAEIETLLRAGITFKFEGGKEAEIFGGSPVYAAALNSLLRGLIEAVSASRGERHAKNIEDWYNLSGHRHRWQIVIQRTATHPRWSEMDFVDRFRWIANVAAPFLVVEQTARSIESRVEELLRNQHQTQ